MTSILYTDKGGLILIKEGGRSASKERSKLKSGDWAGKVRLLAYLLTSLAKCMAITLGSKEHCLVVWMRHAQNACLTKASLSLL